MPKESSKTKGRGHLFRHEQSKDNDPDFEPRTYIEIEETKVKKYFGTISGKHQQRKIVVGQQKKIL